MNWALGQATVRDAGFTLIEATAALAIGATVLVALLSVRSRLIRQADRAGQVATANVLAGQLAADWRLGRLTVPPLERRSGLDDDSGLRWELACEQVETFESQGAIESSVGKSALNTVGASSGGVFLSRLDVRVFAAEAGEPIVSLRAWRPVTDTGLSGSIP